MYKRSRGDRKLGRLIHIHEIYNMEPASTTRLVSRVDKFIPAFTGAGQVVKVCSHTVAIFVVDLAKVDLL